MSIKLPANKKGVNQKGLSLVELMVAMVIGLVLSGAALQLMLTNRQTLTSQQSKNEVEENGRYALDFIMRDVRKAGMRPTTITSKVTTPLVAVDGASGANDSITVTYVLDSSDANAKPYDCNGNALTGTNPTVTNRYYVNASGALMCDGNGSATDGLVVDGVDSLQILYGIDTTANSQLAVTKWVSVPAASDNIVAVRIGLLVRSDTAMPNLPAATAVNVLGQTVSSTTLSDGRIHRLFVSSTLLRNNLDPESTNY